MKIVFLIASYVPHQLLILNTLIEKHGAVVHSFSISKKYTFIPENRSGLFTYKSPDFSRTELLKKVIELDPDLVVVSGWMNSDYVAISKNLRSTLKVPIVSYSDTQWYGTLKQRVNAFISPWHVKKAFSHIWIAGIYQFEYARMLGFSKENIIFNSLSADVPLFHKAEITHKAQNYPKNFLYVGRLIPTKGLDILLKAWENILDKRGWTLTIVGNGPLSSVIKADKTIILKDFMKQEDLISEMQSSGCFVLPSRKESWALVIHEAVSAGLPMICTQTCGAAAHFVIDKFNGWKVNKEDVTDLHAAMMKIMDLDSNELYTYSINSRKLSTSITPELSAASLVQLIR